MKKFDNAMIALDEISFSIRGGANCSIGEESEKVAAFRCFLAAKTFAAVVGFHLLLFLIEIAPGYIVFERGDLVLIIATQGMQALLDQ